MSLLDRDALDRARRHAGVLPTKLASQLQMSVDTTTGIMADDAKDKDITLADLGHLASALGVSPRDLLAGARKTASSQALSARLEALLHRDGSASLASLAMRLTTTIDELLAEIHAYNADERGLKIMRWSDSVGLIADPAIDLPPRGDADAGDAADLDSLLWQVIDRATPRRPPKAVLARLEQLERDGLVVLSAGQWRPTDTVIETLELTDWDTLKLVAFAHDDVDPVDSAA